MATVAGLVPGAVFASDWTTYNHDNVRSGSDPATAGDVLALRWSASAGGGQVYAQPLIAGGVVYVASETNLLTAIDLATGRIAWTLQLAQPFAVTSNTPLCSNITPWIGVTSTPVIDPATNLLYAVGFVAAGHYTQFAVDLASHSLRWQRDLAPPQDFDPLAQGQRAALLLVGGTVYTAFASRGDCGTYRGWVAGVPADGVAATKYLEVSQENGGGIWAPAGPVADSTGIYVATGNSASGNTYCPASQAYTRTNSVVKVSFDLGASPLGAWAPLNWYDSNCSDQDVASTAPELVGGHHLFQVGKDGIGHLLDANALGVGPGAGLAAHPVCGTRPGDGAYGGDAYLAPYLFVPCGDGVRRLTIGSSDFSVDWVATGCTKGGLALAIYLWCGQSGTLTGLDVASGQVAFKSPFLEAMTTSFPSVAASEGWLVTAGTQTVFAFQVHIDNPVAPQSGRPWTGGSSAVGAPAGTNQAYFAEGFTGANFQEYLTVLNLGSTWDALNVDYYFSAGHATVQHRLGPHARLTIDVNRDVGPGRDVAARLWTALGGRFVAERPMYFNFGPGRTGGHDVAGAASPGTRFYFAEGYTGTGFDEYLTLANPEPARTATASATYFFGDGTSLTRQYRIGPQTRFTAHVNDEVGGGRDVAMLVQADLPIVAERPMYFSYGPGWTGGHVAIGSPAPATSLDLAEGYVGPGFDEYLTLLNPADAQTAATLTFFLPDGSTRVLQQAVPPGTRRTVLVNGVLTGSNSVHIDSTGLGLVVERSLYFDYRGRDGGTDVVAQAIPAPGTAYYLAEGFVGANVDEYLTVENPDPTATARVDIVFRDPDGASPASLSVFVGPHSRYTLFANTVVGANTAVAAVVTSTSPILVERSLYFSY